MVIVAITHSMSRDLFSGAGLLCSPADRLERPALRADQTGGRYNAEMNLKFICSEDFGIAVIGGQALKFSVLH